MTTELRKRIQILSGSATESTKRYPLAHIALDFLLCLSLIGCSFTTTSSNADGGNHPRPDSVTAHAPAADIWQVLANAVDAKSIETMSQLTQYILVLARNGDLSAEDVATFDTGFPGATKNDRPLNDSDSKQLRMLK